MTKVSLTKAVAVAVDDAFAHEDLQAFTQLAGRDGMSIRRYYRRTAATECEVSVYVDKWWEKSGGRIHVELYCLVDHVQKRLGGCEQSWIDPDYARPLCHFQYRAGRHSTDTQYEVFSQDDARAFGTSLLRFLLADGLPWFERFQSEQGVLDYLREQGNHAWLAELHAHRGEAQSARVSFREFMRACPRNVEEVLNRMVAAGVINESEAAALRLASLQEETEYHNRVKRWCEENA